MSYHHRLHFRVSSAMHAAVLDLAREREIDVGKLLRQLVARELLNKRDILVDVREQVLFCAVGIDGLLAVQADPTLRPKLVQVWQERLLEEVRDEA